MLGWMDPTTDPCQDFYQFSCGGYLRTHVPLDPGLLAATQRRNLATVWNVLKEEVRDRDDKVTMSMKNFYRSCLHQDSVPDLPGWPDDDDLQLEAQLAKLALAGVFPFFSISAVQLNLTVHLQVTRPPVTSPSSPDLVAAVLQSLGVDNDTEKARDILKFDSQLSQVLKELQEEPHEEILDIAVEDLTTLYPPMKWTEFFEILYDETGISRNISSGRVRVVSKNYIIKLSELLERAESRTLASYLTWRLQLHLLSQGEQQFSDVASPPWRRCVHTVTAAFPEPTTRLLAMLNLPGDSLRELEHCFSVLKKVFFDAIKDSLDESTKETLKMKTTQTPLASAMDEDYMNFLYQNLNLRSTSFIHNVHQLSKNRLRLMLVNEGGGDLFNLQNLDPLAAEYGSPTDIPVATLGSPFFQPGRPKYLNYAGIGRILGHRLLNILDSTVSNKNRINEILQELQSCSKEQHPNLEDKDKSKVSSFFHDATVDSGALNLAYLAYKLHVDQGGVDASLPGLPYSTTQLFLISAAQVWCEVRAEDDGNWTSDDTLNTNRVNAAVSNFRQFGDFFHCDDTSPFSQHSECFHQ